MSTSELCEAISAAAASEGVDPAALEAVVEIESGGLAIVLVDGRPEPPIRWEGHYFDRLCKASVRALARRSGLASPRAGGVANPPSQAGRWAMLRRAAALDRDAAYQSASWGVGQVMGAHWRALGYAGVYELVAEARSGVEGQLRLMMQFLRHAGLLDALKRRDWAGFARGYNGPDWRRNGYDERLRLAFAACSARRGGAGETAALARGSAGDDVAQLQRKLAAAGFRLRVDGRFGSGTETALQSFQRASGLAPDGIAGPRTMEMLSRRSARSGLFRLAALAGKVAGAVRRLLRNGEANDPASCR